MTLVIEQTITPEEKAAWDAILEEEKTWLKLKETAEQKLAQLRCRYDSNV